MYEFLFEACILRCLNYLLIFIWNMNFFNVFQNSLWFYDFTIRFYDLSLFCIFQIVSKSWF
jgi:hypothetical protein